MKTKVRKTYNQIIRLLILSLTVYFLHQQLIAKKNLSESLQLLSAIWNQANLAYFWIFVLLIPINLFIESIKWRLLMRNIEQISVWRALTAVLTGISVSMFTPNRTGEYLGRVFVLQKADPVKGIIATIIGSYSQLLVTLSAGIIGLIAFLPSLADFHSVLKSSFSLPVVILFMSLLLGVYFFLPKIASGMKRFVKQKISTYLEVVQAFSLVELLAFISLSLLRYVVFTFQFYVLLRFFQLEISYKEAMMLISVFYLAMSIIPSITLAELGIRGSVGLFVFQQYFDDKGLWNETMQLSVLSVSSLLWLMNVALAALIGAFLVFQLKFIRK